jgi:2-C-methyl-D-erythritol 4-phosphate cytidylyltransferase
VSGLEDRDVTAQHVPCGDVAVLVPAAGLGARLGPGAPKALRQLAGAPLLWHAVHGLGRAGGVGCIVVAAPEGTDRAVRELLARAVPDAVELVVVTGGATRQASVANALAGAPAGYPIILVHDAARALAPPELVERVAAAVRNGYPAVIPVLAVVDTIKQVDPDGTVLATVDRSSLRVVQTPQGFTREVLLAAHRAAPDDRTDDAGLAERIGVRVHCVPGSERALKITRPVDLALAELWLATEPMPASESLLAPERLP